MINNAVSLPTAETINNLPDEYAPIECECEDRKNPLIIGVQQELLKLFRKLGIFDSDQHPMVQIKLAGKEWLTSELIVSARIIFEPGSSGYPTLCHLPSDSTERIYAEDNVQHIIEVAASQLKKAAMASNQHVEPFKRQEIVIPATPEKPSAKIVFNRSTLSEANFDVLIKTLESELLYDCKRTTVDFALPLNSYMLAAIKSRFPEWIFDTLDLGSKYVLECTPKKPKINASAQLIHDNTTIGADAKSANGFSKRSSQQQAGPSHYELQQAAQKTR